MEEYPVFNYQSIGNGVYAVDFSNIVKINSRYKLTDIENALNNKDVKKLIEMSNYFYMTSGEYRRIIHSFSDIHTFKYVYAPLLVTTKKAGKYDKTYGEVSNYLMNYNVEDVNRFITFNVLLNGAFYGYERVFDDLFVLQELPVQYCRSVYKINGLNAIEFDFKFFDSFRSEEEKIAMFDQLPDEFLKLYNDYKAGRPTDDGRTKDIQWRMLDPQFTRCHFLTFDKTPFFAAVFPDLVSLQEYKEIDKTKSKLDIYKLLVQKIPVSNDGKPLMNEIQARDVHQNAKKMLGNDSQVDVLSSPCEISSVDLANRGEKSQDVINNGMTNVFNSIGTSQVLFNSTTAGAVGLSNALRNDESLIVPLIKDYERHYNQRLKNFGAAKINFFIKDLGITIYNYAEKVSQFQSQATLGGNKLPFLVASTGMTQYEVISFAMFEDNIDLMSLLIPLSSSYTAGAESENTTGNKGGRPKSNDNDLSDSGARQREEEINDNTVV